MRKSKSAEAAPKTKKPFYKRVWFWVVVLLIVILGFGGNSDDQTGSPSVTEPAESVTVTAPAVTEDAALPFDVSFFKDFRNDVTGRWRKSLIATDSQPQDYALAYYHLYFQADDEVHVIYNFSLNTVNTLTVVGDVLNVNITEYVSGEEHDAKIACGGNFLGTYQIDLETGDVLYNSFSD